MKFTHLTTSLLIVAFAFMASAPSAFAKGNAYGHFIAPGWIKKNGMLPAPSNLDSLPKGIRVKIEGSGGSGGSTTTDTTAPLLSVPSAHPATSSVTVTWTTNESADSTLYVSTTSPVVIGSLGTQVVTSASMQTSHSLSLSGLLPHTLYYGKVASKDGSGNTGTSDSFSFMTDALSDSTGPVISGIGIVSGTSSTDISWHTDEPATSKVYYATTSGFAVGDMGVASATDATLSTNHSLHLSGLASSTIYYVIIESVDALLNMTRTIHFLFLTGS